MCLCPHSQLIWQATRDITEVHFSFWHSYGICSELLQAVVFISPTSLMMSMAQNVSFLLFLLPHAAFINKINFDVSFVVSCCLLISPSAEVFLGCMGGSCVTGRWVMWGLLLFLVTYRSENGETEDSVRMWTVCYCVSNVSLNTFLLI